MVLGVGQAIGRIAHFKQIVMAKAGYLIDLNLRLKPEV